MMEVPVISVANMRESDAQTIQKLGSGLELMQRAGRGLYLAAKEHASSKAIPDNPWTGIISILSGTGNNGGDGFALACVLADAGIASTVYQMSHSISPDSTHFREVANSKGVAVRTVIAQDATQEENVCKDDTISVETLRDVLLNSNTIVDCLLGTGFHGKLEGMLRYVVLATNESSAYVVSADINSGLNGDTGIASLAVCSDLTVSIGYFKVGMLRADAAHYIGHLANADIGIDLAYKEDRMLDPVAYSAARSRAQTQEKGEEVLESFGCEGAMTYCQPCWVTLEPVVVVHR